MAPPPIATVRFFAKKTVTTRKLRIGKPNKKNNSQTLKNIINKSNNNNQVNDNSSVPATQSNNVPENMQYLYTTIHDNN